MNQLGFTGAWPPLELWDKYPNWEYALDEEDWPGQVETTLRPSMNVEFIHEDVAYTAGDRRLLIPVIRPFPCNCFDASQVCYKWLGAILQH